MKSALMLSLGLLFVGAVYALDDEPDGLSWELFSQDRELLLDFYDWAKTNPPPAEIHQPSTFNLQRSTSFPYVWIKPAQLPFVEMNAPRKKPGDDGGWTTNTMSGCEVLRMKSYGMSICYQTFEVPEDGTYRFWIRYRHKKGFTESNCFRLTPALDEEHPERDDGSALFAAFEQMFGLANYFQSVIHYTRPRNPVPQICDVETPAGDYLWEATHKMAFLKKGRYVARFQPPVVTTPRRDICISDYVLVGDPFFSPETMMRPDRSEAGRLPVTKETRSPLYAIRPGADFDNAAPTLRSWWYRWRKALYGKLIAAEHSSDYVWGTFAAMPAFSERLNAVDRVSQFPLLAERDRQPSDTYKVDADQFEYDGNWEPLSGRYDPTACAHAIYINGLKKGRATCRMTVKKPGRYFLHTLIYQLYALKGHIRGALRVGVCSGDREVVSYIVGAGDGSIVSRNETVVEDGVVEVRATGGNNRRKSVWNVSEGFDLPAGEVTLVVEAVYPPWAPPRYPKLGGRIFCRAVLTARPDFNPLIEHEFPWGDRIGDDEIGFWRSPDPWTAFSRYSPAATGKYAENIGKEEFRRYDWTPLATNEINRSEHDLEVAAGEVVSELFMIRNNTAKPIGIKPELGGGLKARCRLIAWAPVPDGEYVPRFLLERARIALPAHQNTALWINIDCRGVKAGTYPVTLDFGGRRHTWNVRVKGTIEDVPGPYSYPWAQPGPRRSCWELYRDLGFNVIHTRDDRKMENLSKRAAETYGIRLVRDTLGRYDEKNYTDRVKASLADWKRRGFDCRDFCYMFSDEPGFGAMTNWMKCAKAIKAVDPKAQLWCNTGFFPDERQWDDCREFMAHWDVFCPFRNAFLPAKGRSEEHLAAYRRVGSIRLGYITPSDSIYWIADGANDSLRFAELCRREGRDGWALVRMQTCDGWDLAYPRLQAIFDGAWGRTISTRYAEAAREANQRWRKECKSSGQTGGTDESRK